MGRRPKDKEKDIRKKFCSRCWQNKTIDNFLVNRGKAERELNWCEECRKDITKRHRLWASLTLSRHKSRGFEVKISLEELHQLAVETLYCPICGDKIDWNSNKGKHTENSPSLDRKDNEDRMDLNNTWIICYRCNRSKGTMSLPEFVGYCEHIYKRYKKLWS